MAAFHWLRVWTQDVSQPCLRSDSHSAREVYVRLKGGLSLKDGHLLKLLKRLYGLTDSVDYRHTTMSKHVKEDLKITSLTDDLACLIKMKNGNLQGMIDVRTDDSTGNSH